MTHSSQSEFEQFDSKIERTLSQLRKKSIENMEHISDERDAHSMLDFAKPPTNIDVPALGGQLCNLIHLKSNRSSFK